MLLSVSLAVLLAIAPGEKAARDFVDALVRDDLEAVKGSARILAPLGYARDMLRLYDHVEVASWRVDSVETRGELTYVLVQLDASAVAVVSGRRVPWPHWWSIELRGDELVSVMTLERRLADRYATRPGELDALLRAHPELDVEQFMTLLTYIAYNQHFCDTFLWMLHYTHARGMAASESAAYQGLALLADEREQLDVGEIVTTSERALKLAEADGRSATLSDAHHMVGWAYWRAGRLDDAIRELQRAASYFGQDDDPRVAMLSMHYIVEIERSRNRLREALAAAEQHHAMLDRFSTPRNRKESAEQLADIHERLGNLDVAQRYAEEVRRIAHEMRDDGAEARAMLRLASWSPDARWLLAEAYRVGREAMEDRGALIQLALVDLQLAGNDFDAAESELAEAMTGAQRSQSDKIVASVLTKRSALRFLQGRAEQALSDARAARALAAGDADKTDNPLAEAVAAEARALRALSRDDEAEAAWRAAIDVVELDVAERALDATSSAAVLKSKVTPYRELLDLLVQQGCVDEALAVAERMRARSLRHALRHRQVDPSNGPAPADRAREEKLERAMADVNRRLLAANDKPVIEKLRRERDDARLALRRFRSELRAAHPELRADAAGESDAQRPVLAAGEVVIETAVNDDATFVFVLRGENIAVRRVPIARTALEERVNAFVSSLEQRDLAYRPAARALYDLLLGPAAAELARARSIRIVPDGVLWRLPFHALVDERGRHLAERAAVSYAPSLALPGRASTRRPGARSLLAFADPAIQVRTAVATRSLYRDVTLGRLPDAAAEARTIARLYDGATVRVGADARESAFKREAPAFRVLHLAAHSIVDDGAPMFSSIVLSSSGANPLEDGLLEAREVADLDLGADLAVLSACETARGAVTPGEGVLGLSWAFLAAGVPTTVVSQWKVASVSTARLMIHFHRRLRDGAKPAEALRAAMLELRRDPRWQHPFYWAPFVVIGNSGTPSERQ